MNARRIATWTTTLLVATLTFGPSMSQAAPAPSGKAAAPSDADRPAPAPALSQQPRLVGSQPGSGGEMVGNTVALLFADLDSANGAPPVEVIDQGSRATIANQTKLSCKGTGSARRCLLLVTLSKTEVGHRYRVTTAGAVVEVRSAAGHPGDRAR